MTRKRVLAAALVVSIAATACSRLQPRTGLEFMSRSTEAAAPEGGTVRVAIERPKTLDPAHMYDSAARLVASVVCDTLIGLDPETGEARPGLARSVVSTAAGLAHTVMLRKGVRLHDGSRLDTFDVKESWSRASRQQTASFAADVLSPIAGWDETRHNLDAPTDAQEEERRNLSGMTAISRESFTVSIGTSGGDSSFFRRMSHPVTAPVATADHSSRAMPGPPACAGPYRFVGPADPAADVIVVERFDEYYQENGAFTNGGSGYADRIEFHLFDDVDAAFDAFLAGTVDLAAVPPRRLAEAREQRLGDLVVGVDPRVGLIGLPASVTGDRSVRLALSVALDRSAIARDVYGGGVVPATGFYPPGVGEPYRSDGCPTVPSTAQPELARNLLSSAAAVPTGPMRLYYNDDYRNRMLAEAVAAQWRDRLGLVVDPVAVPWNEYRRRGESTEGFDGPFLMSWEPTVASAVEYLRPLFSSGSIGGDNWTHYSDVAFDRVLAGALSADLPEHQIASLIAAELHLCANMPSIPIVFGQTEYVVNGQRIGSATGTWVDVTTGFPVLRELYVKR